jgi:mRNA interferase RelE/StbE
MVSYKLVIKPSVEKDLRPLPKLAKMRLLAQMDELTTNPFPNGSLKLAGAEQLYRVRVGVYRVIYAVEVDTKTVTVHYARHRREAYRGL